MMTVEQARAELAAQNWPRTDLAEMHRLERQLEAACDAHGYSFTDAQGGVHHVAPRTSRAK